MKYISRHLVFLLIVEGVLSLSGCVALNVLEYTTPENADRIWDGVTPNSMNNYEGQMQVGVNIPSGKIKSLMDLRCSEINDSFIVGSQSIGTSGPYSTPYYYKCVSKPIGLTKKTDIFSLTEKIEMQLDTVNKGEDKNISFEDAQNKCKELGFTPKTEKFGKCVLQLIK
jgi:hypothetical protein